MNCLVIVCVRASETFSLNCNCAHFSKEEVQTGSQTVLSITSKFSQSESKAEKPMHSRSPAKYADENRVDYTLCLQNELFYFKPFLTFLCDVLLSMHAYFLFLLPNVGV